MTVLLCRPANRQHQAAGEHKQRPKRGERVIATTKVTIQTELCQVVVRGVTACWWGRVLLHLPDFSLGRLVVLVSGGV